MNTPWVPSTELTEKVINSSLDGILAFDTNFRYTLINPVIEKICGMPKEEILGHIAFEKFPFLVENGEDKYFRDAIKGKTSFSTDRVYSIPQTGKTGNFEAVYSPLFDENQNIIGGLSIVRETSELKRTSSALKESELKLTTLTKVSTEGIVVCNGYGEILSWNKSAQRIFDYSEEEIIGDNLSVILPSFQWRDEVRELKIANDNEKVIRLFGIKKGGSNIPVAITSSPWRCGLGVFLTIAIRDMTDVTRLEFQAVEHKEISEALLQVQNDLHQGILVLDSLTGRPIYINQAFANMVNYSVEELTKKENLLFLIDEDQIPLLKRRVNQKLKGDHSVDNFELTLIAKNGKKVYAELAMKRLETSFGLAVYCIVRDVSQKRLTENALRRTEAQYQFMFKNAMAIVSTLDLEGRIETINLSFEKNLGYNSQEWIGKSFLKLVHPDDREKVKQRIKSLGTKDLNIRLRDSKGDYIQSEVYFTSIADGGRISSILAIVRIQALQVLNQSSSL